MNFFFVIPLKLTSNKSVLQAKVKSSQNPKLRSVTGSDFSHTVIYVPLAVKGIF